MSNTGINLQNALLDHVFTNGGSFTPTLTTILQSVNVIYMSLHTANPGEGGNQTTSEVSYTGYTRANNLARSTSGWIVDPITSTAKNTPAGPFPPCTAAPVNGVKYVGWGTSQTGVGVLLFYAPIVASTDDWFTLITNQRATVGTATGWVLAQLNHLGADPVLAQDDELAIMKTYSDSLHTNLSAATPYFISNGTAIEGAWDTGLAFKLAITSGAGANPLVAAKCHSMQAIRVTPIDVLVGVTPFIPALGAIVTAV